MIKLIKSTFFEEENTKSKLIDFIFKTSMLSMGEQCRKFEILFSEKQKRKFAVFVSNGSMANLVLLQALLNLGLLKRGAHVGFSALTWATNVMPIIQLGMIPVPIDCSLQTLNISPLELEKKIHNIDALFLTNVLGFGDDLTKLKKMCESEHVLFFEDNCESLGSKMDGELLGNFGIASTFSFFVGHHLSTIEGGMICTDDENLYNMLVLVRAHGWDRNLSPDAQQQLRLRCNVDEFYSKYTFHDLAFNARPTEINGFLGCEQICFWDEIVEKRERNFRLFMSAIGSCEDFIPLELDHLDIVSNFAMPLVCKTSALTEMYKKRFVEANVEIRPIVAGDMTRQIFFQKHVTTDSVCPHAQFIHTNGFYFGNNPEMTDEELSQIVSLLRP